MAKVVVLAIVLACACSKSNPNYCAGAPQNNCTLGDGGPDAPKGCTSAAECAGTADPVCDLTKHQCVQCNSPDYNVCMGTATPVCDLTNETCRACAAHAECGSPGACLPDGSCGGDANVAWVMSGASDTGTCKQSDPCGTIGHALMQNRPYIKLAAGNYSEQPTIQQNVTILADAGAKLLGVVVGPMVTVKGTSTVSIHDLEITQGPGTTGIGVYVASIDAPVLTLDHVIIDTNTAAGLNIGGGNLTVSRSVISGNLGGGAIISGATFDIRNTLFVANGSATSTTGGLTLAPAQTSIFSFNTVADNVSSSGTSTSRGINCTIAMNMTSNIVTNNAASSNCALDYSLFDTGTPTLHNKVGSPAFVNTMTSDPTAVTYYRITNASAAIDSADPASSLKIDIDDHPRPQGTTFDIGASEYMP